MKKFITGFILGSILFGTSIYAATTYYYAANEVSYTPNDTTWHVESVDKALDDLHYKVKNYMPIPTATKTITSNGTDIDVKKYAKVNVNVSSINGNVITGETSVTGCGYIDVSIPTVDANKSYVIAEGYQTNFVGDGNNFGTQVAAYLTSNNNIRIFYQSYGRNVYIRYQVVQLSNGHVQRGTYDIGVGANTKDISISSVNTNNTFVITGTALTSKVGIRENHDPSSVGYLTSSSNLRVQSAVYSATSGSAAHVTWQVVTIN